MPRFNHTKEPFRLDGNTILATRQDASGTERCFDIANLCRVDAAENAGRPETHANGLLFAASQRMLEALDEADTAFAVFNLCGDVPQTRHCVRDAWAKVNSAMSEATGNPDLFAEANPDAAAICRVREAAPELLEALTNLVERLDSSETKFCLDQARAAIAKATEEQ